MQNVLLLIAGRLSVIMFNFVTIKAVILSVFGLNVCYTDCRYATCYFAECFYAKFRYAKCLMAKSLLRCVPLR